MLSKIKVNAEIYEGNVFRLLRIVLNKQTNCWSCSCLKKRFCGPSEFCLSCLSVCLCLCYGPRCLKWMFIHSFIHNILKYSILHSRLPGWVTEHTQGSFWQAASLTERNNRLAQSTNCCCGRILWGRGVFSYFRCKIWRHILAQRSRFATKVTKFCAYLA